MGATISAQSAGASLERAANVVPGSLEYGGRSPQDLTANCLQWVTAPASVDHSLLEGVCADVVSDLAGIGARLGLPVLAPTNSRFTDPLAIVFAPTDVNSKTLAVTGYFNGVKHHLKPGSPNEGFVIEPCQITLYPLMYDNEHALLGGVSDRLHVLLSHEVVHCYQDVVFSYKEATQGSLPSFMTEGSATYLATSYAGYGEQGTPASGARDGSGYRAGTSQCGVTTPWAGTHSSLMSLGTTCGRRWWTLGAPSSPAGHRSSYLHWAATRSRWRGLGGHRW